MSSFENVSLYTKCVCMRACVCVVLCMCALEGEGVSLVFDSNSGEV
jgi:hypothetical protein